MNRIKGVGYGGGRCGWWTASVRSGLSTDCVNVDYGGNSGDWHASGELFVPVCFRIDEA